MIKLNDMDIKTVSSFFRFSLQYFAIFFAFSACTKSTSWKTIALDDLFLSGKVSSKEIADQWQSSGSLPSNWIVIERSDIGIIFEKTEDEKKGKGLRLLSLVDKKTHTIISAIESIPLFTVELMDKSTGTIVTIHAEEGWRTIKIDRKSESIKFTGSLLPDGEKLCIVLQALRNFSGANPAVYKGIDWNWKVEQGIDRYELHKLNFPQISLRNLGATMKVFYPYASGVIANDPCGQMFSWSGTYPSGWTSSMQWTASYDETKNSGFYMAMHDPKGSVKDISLSFDSTSNSLNLRFEHHLVLNDTMTNIEYGGSVWQTFSGDWFDAALIYRHWIQNHALWFPKLKQGEDGRTNTPQWFKELCVWAVSDQSPQKMPKIMRKFTDSLGIPTALHWYNWHQIPFDNDYPHYFPPKEGFKEAVTEIQKKNDCYVMPYINGRLWDIRDKGVDDFQFTSVALPGATKKKDGAPHIETYGSKESDGTEVELAVMCPATDVWKDKIAEIIFRLTNDFGVEGVYVDQVAAAKPVLCYDKLHGHPLVGGSWWNSEYWKIFEKIRELLPEGKIITTECNAETFVNVFDGFLTWHFQYQDQVPAFAAVYGGTLQMFGRAFRNESPHILADRMKLAQQLVYGEQIGWINPQIADDPHRFPYFKEIVHTRYKYRDYFYKGEMIRPPKLLDKIPTVCSDWQWQGEQIISTDAVLTGAWRKTDKKGKTISVIFIFVNVSSKPITSHVAVRLDEIGLKTNVETFENPLLFEPGVPLVIEIFSK